MKKTLSIFALTLMAALFAGAADRVTLTITVTNLPVTGDTLTNNAYARYWTNVLTSGTILTNAAGTTNNFIQRATTNLYTAFVTYPSTGNLIPSWLSATQITLLGQVGGANTAESGGTWCTLVFSTQTITRRFPVVVPIAASVPAALGQETNVLSLLVTDISQSSTNQFETNSTALAKYVATNATFFGVVSNSPAIGGTIYRLTNGWLQKPAIFGAYTTNLTNYGYLWAAGNVNVASNLLLGGPLSILSLSDGDGLLTYDESDDSLILTNDFHDTALSLGVDAIKFVVNGGPAFEVDNSTGYVTARTNLTSSLSTSLKDTMQTGTNQFAAGVGFSVAAVTSIADGNNVIAIPDETVFVSLTGSPTATWTNCAMSGKLWNGRLLILDNATGQNMTIAHESGYESVVEGRRLLTSTAADVVTTGRRVTIWIYNATTARWLLIMGG